ncbi:MAG: methyltransferase [Candidatus Binataceae bacterium]|nr:methyltransferase [Candidatus Binataceae bacterium]
MVIESPDPTANTLLDLIAGHRVTAVIYVSAKLGIADLLVERPRTATELAQLTDTHERSLLRLMRTLVTLGIFKEGAEGRFELTEMGIRLAGKSERSLKAWVLVEGELLRAGWGQLIESIRTGKTADELAGFGSERFEKLAEMKDAGLFNEGMVSMTRAALPALLAACDFAGVSTLLDVGGGLGELMSAILTMYPSMRGIVYDLPHCAEGARMNLSAAGAAERAEFIAGSFFESVPAAADAIILKNIIHDWNDERCLQILRNCHRALRPGARLTAIDRIVPEKLEPKADHLSAMLSDLNMLRGAGGCERTESEHRELLGKSGFRTTRVVPAGRYSLIEATVT